MALWDRVTSMLALTPWDHPERVELSSEFPTIEDQFAAATRQAAPRPWRPASIEEARGVPAIFGATTMVANMAGTLTARAFRDNVPVADADRPAIVVRPNPFGTPRLFFHQTVLSMAERGEAWLWVAARDSQEYALSLIPVPPQEVMVEERRGDWLRPRITWRGKEMKNADMVHIPFSLPPGELRGIGPLQACGAAISVAVEAQEWAANFFAGGGVPSINLHHDDPLTDEEASDLRSQWMETPPNTPQVTSGPMHLNEIGKDIPSGQMLEARNRTAGDVAVMFHIPGSLLEFAREGSSLTYQNVTAEFDKLLRQCLLPDYLEPIEQAISDLLPRSWSTRFNTEALLRADIKTRYDVYKIAIDAGIEMVDEVRAKEGLGRGDIETAPIPLSPPSAVPSSMPQLSLRDIRCKSCKRLLGRAQGAAELRCSHCKSVQLSAA